MEEVATARGFTPAQSVVQIYGTCEECRDRQDVADHRRRDDRARCSRATRCAWRLPPSAAASTSTRAPPRSRRTQRGRTIFERLAAEEGEHLGTLRKRYRELIDEGSRCSSRVRRSSSSKARRAVCSRPVPTKLSKGVNDQQALLIGIQVRARLAQVLQALRRAFRGLGRQADLPRVCRRGARAPRPADSRVPRARASGSVGRSTKPRRRQVAPLIDLHTHTTASDGRCTPAELVARASAAGAHRAERDRPRHASPRRRRPPRRAQASASSSCRASRSPRCATAPTSTCSATSSTARRRCSSSSSAGSGAAGSTASRQMIERLARAWAFTLDAEAIAQAGLDDSSKAVGRPWIAAALVAGGHVADQERSLRALSRARPRSVRAADGCAA